MDTLTQDTDFFYSSRKIFNWICTINLKKNKTLTDSQYISLKELTKHYEKIEKKHISTVYQEYSIDLIKIQLSRIIINYINKLLRKHYENTK